MNIRQLASDDVGLMQFLLRTFGEAFDDIEAYGRHPARCGLSRPAARRRFGAVVGGIAAYELKKLVKEDGNIDTIGVFHGALDITRYQL